MNRRQAIRVVATGSVVAGSLLLPKQWTKPLVETVVSPAAGQVFSPIICMSNGQTGVLCCPVSAPPYCQVDNSCISDPFCELS